MIISILSKLPKPRIIEFKITDYPMVDANQIVGVLALLVISVVVFRMIRRRFKNA